MRTRGKLGRFQEAELDLKKYREQPIRWWQEVSKKEYPTLAGLAFTVFSMPAMSAECKRVFSRAGKMVTNDRYQLKADIIEADHLKSWLISNLIDRQKAWRVLHEIEESALLQRHLERPLVL